VRINASVETRPMTTIVDLAIKYSKDLKMYEFSSEIECFKFEASTLKNLKTATSFSILQILHDFQLVELYPNVNVSLRICFTLPVSILLVTEVLAN